MKKPNTERHFEIVKRTAAKCVSAPQFEVMLRVKQCSSGGCNGASGDFGFLEPGHGLHLFYSWLKKRYVDERSRESKRADGMCGNGTVASKTNREGKEGDAESSSDDDGRSAEGGISGLLGMYSSSSSDDDGNGDDDKEEEESAAVIPSGVKAKEGAETGCAPFKDSEKATAKAEERESENDHRGPTTVQHDGEGNKNVGAADDACGAEDRKAQRLERLRLWKERRRLAAAVDEEEQTTAKAPLGK